MPSISSHEPFDRVADYRNPSNPQAKAVSGPASHALSNPSEPARATNRVRTSLGFREECTLHVAQGRKDSKRIPVLNIPSFLQITKHAFKDFEADPDKSGRRNRR